MQLLCFAMRMLLCIVRRRKDGTSASCIQISTQRASQQRFALSNRKLASGKVARLPKSECGTLRLSSLAYAPYEATIRRRAVSAQLDHRVRHALGDRHARFDAFALLEHRVCVEPAF